MKYWFSAATYRRENVSILLIVELAFEDALGYGIVIETGGFNPSYRGIGFWRTLQPTRICQAKAVSILLIVELAFEVICAKSTIFITACFNPSYRGIGFWSARPCTFSPGNRMFQSFLSWNWLLKIRIRQLNMQKRNVSILLIVELAFEEVMRLVNYPFTGCFNPSYRGIGFWRGQQCRKHTKYWEFQSFLSWNWLLKLLWEHDIECKVVGFQSFLSWNWLLKI